MSDVLIRRVRRDDGPRVKAIRLRALEADPSSFAATLERESAYDDGEWAEWAESDATGDQATTLLAEQDGEPVGIVAAYRNERDEHMFHVVAMWVAPEVRGRGVGRFLLDSVETWIADAGGTVAELMVAESSVAARRLYESAGYRPDGTTRLSEHMQGLTYVGMRKPVLLPRPAG
ncbi:MAG TPA: GNAT family N-acetyltransferase [Gaiella sp.]